MARAEPAPITLTTSLTEVASIAAGVAAGLAALGVRTVADLVKHLPSRYDQMQAEATISELAPEQLVAARGEITATRISGFGRKQRFQAVLVDPTGRLDLVWFNAPYMRDKVYPGLRVRVHGKAKRYGPPPGLQLVNPVVDVLKAEDEPELREARIRPIYPASEAVPSAKIEQAVARVLEPALEFIDDHLPEKYRRERSLPSLADAYRMIHRPDSMEQAREARRRLAFDELLLLQLGVFLRRAQLRGTTRAPALRFSPAIDAHIRERFPFALTAAQDRVIAEVVQDLGSSDPANRLIQGDVGSGKTIVALYAMLLAVASKHQAALMAPTEILAEQHFASISRVLSGSSVRLALLTGGVTGGERQAILQGLATGDIDIVVGTHALLTEHVRFNSLAVAVIDEQHRFGVQQRALLRSKGSILAEDGSALDNSGLFQARTTQKKTNPPPAPPSKSGALTPHVLVMTATPIPRTLALTLYGDLDVSVIDELPPGRTPITTRVVGPMISGEVYKYVRTRIDAGDQAYVVVPAIDSGASSAGAGGGDAELQDLRSVQARLEAHELAGTRIAALHGRLSSATREAIMTRFRAGQIDVLVATTVIEVGVDVPNATIMVIEHAERFGLAQLHQLRGRVGRGSKKSVCVLIGEAKTADAQARLEVMAKVSDGFALAERDLEIRGPGEVFGMRQAGAPPFQVADLATDRELLALARRDAAAWIERSPSLADPEETLLRKRLFRTHGKWLGLGEVG